jgi:hypothetical protein
MRVFARETTDLRPSTSAFGATYYDISPGYLAAAGTPLLAGRDITFSDGAKNPYVAVVNQQFARRLFQADDVVGRYFKTGSGHSFQIVGVVATGKYTHPQRSARCGHIPSYSGGSEYLNHAHRPHPS